MRPSPRLLLNAIEAESSDLHHQGRSVENDISLWRYSGDKFKKTFTTKTIWNIIRTPSPRKEWYKGVWFSYATPKYSFLTWLTVHDRLSTGDRIKHWNSGQQVDCIFCDTTEESRNHLFFACQYSSAVWSSLSQGLLANDYSTDWQQLVTLISSSNLPKIKTFLLRYVFQSTLYHLWRERNARRHGEIPQPHAQLTKRIDKNIRNRLSSIPTGGFEDGL